MRYLKKFIAGFLVTTLVAPALLVAPPAERAHAIFGVGDTVIEIGANLYTNIKTTIATTLEEIKEYIADGLGYAIVNAIIRQMSNDIITWINSGFDGNPAFVTDLGGYLGRVGDEVAGDFIYNSTYLSFLCSPFRLDVQLSIAFSYFSPDEPECTLSDVVDNIDGFLVDFNQGGWDGWYELTVRDHNNPYDAYLEATSRLNARIVTSKGEELKLLDFGQGFLSFRDCSAGENLAARNSGSARPDDGGSTSQCPISTPGTVIESQLAKTLGLSADRLVLADEINEILGALFTQLASQVLGGGGGLRGLSYSSPDRASYLERLVNDDEVTARAIDNAQERLMPHISESLGNESQYREEKTASLSSTLSAESAVREVQACYEHKLETTSLSQSERETAQERIAAASSTIAAKIAPRKLALQGDINASHNATTALEGVAGRLMSASTAEDANGVLTGYTNLQRSDILHDLGDVTQAQEERAAVTTEMDDLIEQAEKDLETCRAFGTSSADDRQ